MRFAGMAVALCLVLAGCGGSDSPKAAAPAKKATTKATAKVTPTPSAKVTPTVADPTGVPAPADLSDFLCSADAKGVWNAAGILNNESKKAATYQVTVYVGLANGKDSRALTKQVQSVLAGGSTTVELTGIPAAKDATQCYVQVLRK